jgi:hypothetical protein
MVNHATPVQQWHIPPVPAQQTQAYLAPAAAYLAHAQQAQGIHAMRQAPMYSYNSPAFQMPTISQQAMPTQQVSILRMPMQQAASILRMPMQQAAM